MTDLWLYNKIDSLGLRNYRAKIMTVAFLGTHVPLIALVGYVALQSSSNWGRFLWTLAIALAATLLGTGSTLFVLNHLLRPVLMTGRALRSYRQSRQFVPLPTGYADEVGRLMADASDTLTQLDLALDTLEYSDAVTKLPNGKRLSQHIALRLAEGESFAVCAMRFVTYGRIVEATSLDAAEHAAANIAARLTAAFAGFGPLYRVSGSDFAVLASKMRDVRALEASVRQMLRDCSGSLEGAGVAIEVVLKAGVALAPTDAAEPAALIDHALAALTTPSDPQQVRFHSPAARALAREQFRIEQELRRGLANDEFVLHYQPVVDLTARRTVGAEALIRWRHPEQGLLYPAKFIGVAEAVGLIDQIDLWVLKTACRQIHQWRGSELDALHVAVNLSARQFVDPNLISHVREAIRAAGISPERLEVELTETTATTDYQHTRAAFGKLRDLGVSVAIDDFGTGFASLSCLRKLPFNKLKIDREFVTNVNKAPESQAICRALVALGDGLGMKVLAEGTETVEEVKYLGGLGCNLYQGYYFAKPLPVEEFQLGVNKATLSSLQLAKQKAAAA